MKNIRIICIILLMVCMVLPSGAQVVEAASEVETPALEKKETLFSWSASALVTSNYIWRGLYCGGPSLQLEDRKSVV